MKPTLPWVITCFERVSGSGKGEVIMEEEKLTLKSDDFKVSQVSEVALRPILLPA